MSDGYDGGDSGRDKHLAQEGLLLYHVETMPAHFSFARLSRWLILDTHIGVAGKAVVVENRVAAGIAGALFVAAGIMLAAAGIFAEIRRDREASNA